MKILIVMDAEGCYDYSSNNPASASSAMQKELVSILNIISPSDNRITVLDFHGIGNNFSSIVSNFPEVSFVSQIWNLHSFDYDYSILVGFHSKAGTSSPNAHTLRPEFLDVRCGGNSVGELFVISNWLSYYSIPVAFVCGEEKLIYELQGIHTCAFFYGSNYKLDDMLNSLKSALAGFNVALLENKYNSEEISLRLSCNIYMELLPQELFIKRDGCVFCQNTHTFVTLLPAIIKCIELGNSILISASNKLKEIASQCSDVYQQLKENYPGLFQIPRDQIGTKDISNILKCI